MKNAYALRKSRRDFLSKSLSTCALCCVAAPKLFGVGETREELVQTAVHKFDVKSGISIQDAFTIAFGETYIPIMRSLQRQIGHEKFIEVLKAAADTMQEEPAADTNYSEHTLELWTRSAKQVLDTWWDNRLTYEILREDAEVFEIKFTECLWAKTFRDNNAADLGFAGICYQDYGVLRRFNPQLELIREKTLMQGADCCIFRWQKKKA